MYDDVVVPTDGSAAATAVVEDVTAFARSHDATVHGLYVVDTRFAPVEGTIRALEYEFEDAPDPTEEHPTAVLGRRLREAGVDYESDFRVGVPNERILGYADHVDADVIAMGTHARSGVYRFLAGSTTERVLRKADVPVLTVPVEQT
ncbi:universal stress protein [Haloplanus sp. GCM10025708]|uniref:universal stress protein n=1 Tax=Haloferacaceae TaxID=1644056 RepID=UPI003612B2EE